MKPAASLSLRSLTSKIHPPLTLNPRESQQLLSLLTSSFRQQLDHEHPSFWKDVVPGLDAKGRGRQGEASLRKGQTKEEHQNHSSPTASFTLANSHIQSILTNPLFSHAPKKRRISSPNRSILNKPSGFDSAQRIFSNPMAWFDEQFALGTATVDMAAFCLDTHQKSLRSSPELSMTKAMRASGAGSRVLRWMGSTELTKSNEFLSYEKLISLLVPYLVAEERQAVIWEWLDRETPVPSGLDHQTTSTEKSRLPDADLVKEKWQLLLKLVKAEYYQGEGIDGALTQFLRFVHKRKAVNTVDLMTSSRSTHWLNKAQNVSAPAGQFLTSVLTSNPRASAPNQELFDEICCCVGDWAAEHTLSFARLQAYHPTNPDPIPSLRYFRSLSLDSLPVSVKKRKYTVTLLLETARLLLEKGKLDDANWLMRYTGAGFAEDLGLEKSETRQSASAYRPRSYSKEQELSNLQLLEGLELRYS